MRRGRTWRRSQAISYGSLMGARGNSGVILSQILRGLAEAVQGRGRDRRATPRRRADRRRRRRLPGGADAGRRHHPDRGAGGRGREPPTAAAARPRWSSASRPPGRGGRGASADPRACCPCSRRPGWSTPAGPGLVLLLDAFLHVADGRALPDAPPATAPMSQRGRPPTGHAPGETEWRPALRGDVSPGGARRPGPAVPARSGPGSATRSSSSAATACGTATSTPTTSAPPSRPPSKPAGPARSGSPTCASRSKRSAGCATPPGPAPGRAAREAGVVLGRRRVHRRRDPPHLPLPRRPPRGERRPDHEPLHRRPPRGDRRAPERPGGHPAQQQEHRPRRRAGRPARPSKPVGSCLPGGSRRASPPCSSTTLKATPTPTWPSWPTARPGWSPAR